MSEATAATAGLAESPKQQFLDAYEREHAITTRVLRAFPPDRLDLRPHPRSSSAREVIWTFVLERGLGGRIMRDEFASGAPGGAPPSPPESLDDLLAALERAHREFGDLVRSLSDAELREPVTFMVGPKTPGQAPRIQWLWFLLHDQIHHRGQLSVYLRMADGKVPSIYGPTADEPWI